VCVVIYNTKVKNSMKIWEIRFRCLNSYEPDVVHQEKIPYGYARTREEALEIFWNGLRRNAPEYDVEVVSLNLLEK
jgi:hypothetical protein